MARLLAGFKDPSRRPRLVIWSGVFVLFIAAFAVLAIGVTSTRWFCASICHTVQDDAIIAYQHSSHSQISCLDCHMPVNADPLTFLYHKVKAGVEGAIPVIGNSFEVPLNASSEVALEMPADNCTQCHSVNRKITPSEGIIIDHKAHAERGIRCTQCHNRIAHREDFKLQLKNPDGTPTHKHDDFMEMNGCFRCHGLGKEALAPGTCATCHPKGFELKPASHGMPDFFPGGHAKLALLDDANVAEGEKEAAQEEAAAKGRDGVAYAAEGESSAESSAALFEHLKPMREVSYCGTCHEKATFCKDCHGMDMPHSAEFKAKAHPELVKTAAKKCDYCHKPAKTNFCDNCHHGAKIENAFNAKVPWQRQHADVVRDKGVAPCLGACHEANFCAACHNKKKPVPTSHRASTWVHNKVTVTAYGTSAAKPTAGHAVAALKEISACEVCHGTGGTTSKFCSGCHKLPTPHPAEFKGFHSSTGRKDPKVCANCHQLKEVCSNCHHRGSSQRAAWINIHPKTVDGSGPQQCFEKCHKDKTFCVTCHTKSKAVPSSHKARDWTHRTKASTPARHTKVFAASNDSCSFCHGDGGTSAKFCMSCHKVQMPHEFVDSAPGDAGGKQQKFPHKEGFEAKKLSKATCANCHAQYFCDNCHHTGASTKRPWAANKAGVNVQHPAAVRKNGTTDCFGCHKETFCSYCHVRLSK